MKKLPRNPLRKGIQWGVLILIIAFSFKLPGNDTFDPEAYCPFGGLQTLGTYIVQGSMACSMTATQIMMGLALAAGVILLGKLFCGYLCPLGAVAEYMNKLRNTLGIKEIVIPQGSIADKALRGVKYVLLFTVFYMTLSASELFCKNFDPYYAAASGFRGEITVWMACISITVCFLGSFFIRLFWCKYICPLGAASNIFKFGVTFLAMLLGFWGLEMLGLGLSWVLILIIVCLAGYVYEIVYMKSKVFPLMSVRRNQDLCNDCGICSRQCPYSIQVHKLAEVRHIDCTNCGECISSCRKGALAFNKSNIFRLVPAVSAIVLFFIGLFLGTVFELPTIDERWGDTDNQMKQEKLVLEGMKSVKCYGSSKAFSAQAQKIPGVSGVATFVKHSRVNIFYDPSQTDPETIRKAIYTPSKFKIAVPPRADSLIKVVTIRTENMNDKMDVDYLGIQFANSGRKYFGLETEYACPLIVRLYVALDEPADEEFIKKIVSLKTVEIPGPDGKTLPAETDYKFIGVEEQTDTIARLEFLRRQFNPVNKIFKKEVEKYAGEKTAVYELENPALANASVSRWLPYLSSYLSLTEGILGVQSLLDDNERYILRILYADSRIGPEEIWSLLSSGKWSIKMNDGSVQEIEAKIEFPQPGRTIQ